MRFTDEQLPTFGDVLLDFVVPSELGLKSAAVFRIIRALRDAGCLPGYGHDMAEVALEEALTNAVVHGNQLQRDKPVHVVVQADDQRFAVLIEDQGAGFTEDRIADRDDPDTILAEHGRGIHLIDHYVDELIFQRPGNRQLLVRDRQIQPDPGAVPPSENLGLTAEELAAEEHEPTPDVIDIDDVDAEYRARPRLKEIELPDEIALAEPTDDETTEAAGPVTFEPAGDAIVIARIHIPRITEDNSALVRLTLLDQGLAKAPAMVIDMAEVAFLSSAGIGAITAAYTRARSIGGAVALADVRPAVRNTLSTMGLSRVLRLYDHTDEAVAALAAGP